MCWNIFVRYVNKHIRVSCGNEAALRFDKQADKKLYVICVSSLLFRMSKRYTISKDKAGFWAKEPC